MNYEEAYKKALERAKGLISLCANDRDRKTRIYRVEDIETLFPELQEGRNERIRKDLIWCLKHSGCKMDDLINPHVTTVIKDAIAWLEKQERKTPVK